MYKTEFIDYNELSKIDLYDLLTLTNLATYDDIRRSFKKIAIQYHPDKNKSQTDQDREFFENVQVAYFILSDENRRAKYDESRKQHKDLFYSLKKSSQKNEKSKVDLDEVKKNFKEKVKKLESEHGLNEFMDMDTNSRLKKVSNERNTFQFPKQPIKEFQHKVNGQDFNEVFNKQVEESKSYDIVKYNSESIVPVGNYISLEHFGKLYINGSSEKIFDNNFSIASF